MLSLGRPEKPLSLVPLERDLLPTAQQASKLKWKKAHSLAGAKHGLPTLFTA